uniref:Uncharacterized protein n=1 Tax=Ditylenchus dipsaci TaxID=166011 RepID=A0A915E878_9BILA
MPSSSENVLPICRLNRYVLSSRKLFGWTKAAAGRNSISKESKRKGPRVKSHHNDSYTEEAPEWSEKFNQITSEVPPAFPKPAEPFVQEVVERFAERGKRILLPLADEDAMKMVVQPFQKLINRGVDPDFLVRMCLQHEQLFRAISKNGQEFINVLSAIKSVAQMSFKEVIIFAADWADELAKGTADDVNARLRVFLGRGVEAGKEMRKVIESCPMVLFDSTPQVMDTNWEAISNFFSAKDVLIMCCFHPHIGLIPYKELELRYEYIYGHMGIEPSEFLECTSWPEMDLKEIMMRHSCLKKTGKYVTPDEKRPQLKMENPPMSRIFDTNDREFAGVAGISKEEWLFYKQVFQKEEEKEDKERPYEKVRPNTRKMYERRVKEDVEKVDGEL